MIDSTSLFKRLLIFCFVLGTTSFSKAAFQITTPRVEYTTTPLGIDVATPRFSWQMQSFDRGEAQKSYRIKVTDEAGREMWTSGRVASDVSLNVAYGGRALQPATRYLWTVEVWNLRGQRRSASSWFETGLMVRDDCAAAWDGAQWIGGNNENALTFHSQYLPVYRLRFAVELDASSKSTQAGFIYGANDLRLMDQNKNILGRSNAKNESYVKLVLNIAGFATGDSASLDVYRVGYTQKDRADQPMASFKLPTALISSSNCHGRHSFEVSSMHGTTQIFMDGREKPVAELNLNPMGVGGDYLSFPNVGDLGFSVPNGQKATFSEVAVLNFRLPRHALYHLDEAQTVSGEQRFFTPTETGAPLLRTRFALENKTIRKARIYATARGIYELYLNGKRVGDDFFNPGLTQYNKTLYYQTYDVTDLVKPGDNAWGAILNEGWWSGAISFSGANWNFFGDKQCLLAKLEITYADGTQTTVVTQPSSWRFSNKGPVRLGSLFQGEIYDATREDFVKDWSGATYDDSAWEAAHEVDLAEMISHEQLPGFVQWPCPDDYSHFTLTSQLGAPVRQIRELNSVGVEEVRPGVFVYDMGQNMAGVPCVTFSGLAPGTHVTMRFAEVEYPELPAYKGNEGMVMMENMRGAMHQDIYIAKGGEETFMPRYTYHGYRFVEVTGIPSTSVVRSLKGIVLSSIDSVSAVYETSNKDVNRFFQNVEWSSLANIFSIPTDCPQRNERMGWSGDLSVFSPALSYLFNGAQFLRRHLGALRDTQEDDGAYAAVAPVGGGFGGPLWSSVGIAMPWQSYLQYGDIDAIREHYASMKDFVDLMLTKYVDSEKHYYKGSGGSADLGDWLGFEVNKNDNSLIFDCYLTYELKIMANIAQALGKQADAAYYTQKRSERIDFINSHYIEPTTGKTVGPDLGEAQEGGQKLPGGQKPKGTLIDTQTSYAIPLAFGIVREDLKPRFVENFIHTVTRQSVGDDGKTYPEYSLMTGFIGTAWISMALSEVGRSDLAYQMLLNEQFPSWLYPVKQGATTIWERLNSYTKENGFGGNNSMNSFNHYAFGSVTNWMMQRSLGIARDESAPAFKHFNLCPQVDATGGLTEAKGHYDSMYGRIESSWKVSGNQTIYRFTIPANTSATLRLPLPAGTHLTVNGKAPAKAKGVANVTMGSVAQMELTSGTYECQVCP